MQISKLSISTDETFDYANQDEKIKVIDVDYEGDYDYSSIIDITLENEISNNE